MSWESGWLQFEKPFKQGDVSQWLKKANQLIQSADTKEKVLDLIDAYEQALKLNQRTGSAIWCRIV